MKGFWTKLPKPFFALAPMADVTDAVFRRLIAKYGKPDVMWTEFVSADGLCSPEGKKALLKDLWYTEAERPIVAQFFTGIPEHMKEVAMLARELKFDGIDINMGCPDRGIEKSGGGAVLIKNPKQAQSIIRAAQDGAGDLPVSVKTRIGYHKNIAHDWIKYLLETNLDAISIHARTRNEMSKVPAQWEVIGEIVQLVHQELPEGKRPLIIGNGDVITLEDAAEKAHVYGVDGVMIGRGIFGNPWRFSRTSRIENIPLKERLEVMIEHTFLFEEIFKQSKNFDIMKKHYKAYVNGFDGAKELRMKLMDAKNATEIQQSVDELLRKV